MKHRKNLATGLVALGLLAAACSMPPEDTTSERVALEVSSDDVPGVCLEALDDADRVIGLATEGIEILTDSLTAAAANDVQSLEANNGRMEDMLPEVEDAVTRYTDSAGGCREIAR